MLYIVFDLDGTLLDTQRFHAQIESNYLKEHGIDLTPEQITERFAGRTPREWIAEVLNEHGVNFSDETLEEFELHKNEHIVALAKEWKIGVLPWVVEFIEETRKYDDIVMGISSWTSVKTLEELIPWFKLSIEYYTSADEVEHRKPAPDVFLRTFEKMWAGEWTQKIVIGDGKSDMLWGKAAGAKTIFINQHPEKGVEVGADLAVHSFEELSIEKVKDLLSQ